jgi:glucokinase
LQAADVVAIGAASWQPAPLSVPRNYAVIGPGTGLGVGGLVIRDGRCLALETEGGHAGFAPGTDEEIRILERLSARFGRVSCERLVSGPGLINLHRALCELDGVAAPDLQPADITARAAQGDARSMRAIELFCAVFGAMAGDLVLTHGAWDGVFLAGGLVPRLLEVLPSSAFRARFQAKGRFAATMAKVPSLAVVHPWSGLLGAAVQAVQADAQPRGSA